MASAAATKAFRLVSLPSECSVKGTLFDKVAGKWTMGIWKLG